MFDPLCQNLELLPTLESGIDVGQGITIGPGKFVKKNKHDFGELQK